MGVPLQEKAKKNGERKAFPHANGLMKKLI